MNDYNAVKRKKTPINSERITKHEKPATD